MSALAYMMRGRRLSRRRMPRVAVPDLVEAAYRRTLLDVVGTMRREVEAQLFPVFRRRAELARLQLGLRTDSVESDIDGVRITLGEAVRGEGVRRNVQTIALRTAATQKVDLEAQLRAATAVDVPVTDNNIWPRVQAFTEENVALIKSIPEEALGQVEKLVTRGLAQGVRWETMAEEIQARMGVAESRAALIARDQVGKFYGVVNQVRQAELGLVAYIWRTANDERVRPEHVAREGRRFKWSDAPDDGHPGQAIACRCSAEPDVAGLLDDLAG